MTRMRHAEDTPVRVLIYGSEKVGKSTFAAGSPKPIFLGAENGTERLDVERLQPSTWAEAIEWIDELAVEKHDYKTLVVDPINWLEPMCWAAVVGDNGDTLRGLYKHYKGGLYIVFSESLDEASGEPLVHYYSIEKRTRWTRTVANFVGNADLPGQDSPPRFVRIRLALDAELYQAAFDND